MSLLVYVGLSGQKLEADTARISTLDALRSWVAQTASIQPSKQVYLTSKGKQVRPQTLLTEVRHACAVPHSFAYVKAE